MTRITSVTLPNRLTADPACGRSPAFPIEFTSDRSLPFVQAILWQDGQQHIIPAQAVTDGEPGHYIATVPAGLLSPGHIRVQVEGCSLADLARAGGEHWFKEFSELELLRPARPSVSVGADANGVKIRFGIHKHMHQPYYRAADSNHWDGSLDEIFGSRRGAYVDFLSDAVTQYEAAGLPHAGLSTSWSGTLIAQLQLCAEQGRVGGAFSGWAERTRKTLSLKTQRGHRRLEFTAFGYFHPLMPLIPQRDIVRGIAWHRQIIERVFGVPASPILFPPETALHTRMLPALNEAGIQAVIYDSIHRFRACRDYPYAGPSERLLPPSPAEQVDEDQHDWLQLNNIWAPSRIAAALLRPEYVQSENVDGSRSQLLCVPAERYLGNEDARGGYGALQYPSVFEQLYGHIVASNSFDPKHPPFFLLHSDGDNYGGGADSYYRHNTAALVEWLQSDPRYELCSMHDYLDLFPPDPGQAIHLEPGSWSGADNGDPQFAKWFGRAEQDYSPDLNSWSVLTALQNTVHSIEDTMSDAPGLPEAVSLMMTAETSCYWYWTGQEQWDIQVTLAANEALARLGGAVERCRDLDTLGPTVFPPWSVPSQPGGKTWGPHGGLSDAGPCGTLHTLVYDLTGLARVDVIFRTAAGESGIAMRDHGPYPSRTGTRIAASHFTAELPPGLGVVHYYIEAVDRRGNLTRSSLERIFLG